VVFVVNELDEVSDSGAVAILVVIPVDRPPMHTDTHTHISWLITILRHRRALLSI